MPCMKCANGKWKYGEHGRCQFDTLKACEAAAAAIHIQDKNEEPQQSPLHDPLCPCTCCKQYKDKSSLS